MSHDITIRFKMNREDWSLAIREQLLSKSWSGRVLWIIVWALQLLALVQWLQGRSTFKPNILLGGMVFWGVLFGLWLYRRSPRAYLKGLPAEMIEGEQIYRFTEQGVDQRGPLGESKMDWKVWTRCRESATFFGLAQRSGPINILPKNAFADESQRQSFRDLVRLMLDSPR